GKTPIIVAAFSGRIIALKLLLDRGADVNAQDNEFGNTALMIAAMAKDSPMVRLLLARGANPSIRDKNGVSPLSFLEEHFDKSNSESSKTLALLKKASSSGFRPKSLGEPVLGKHKAPTVTLHCENVKRLPLARTSEEMSVLEEEIQSNRDLEAFALMQR